MARLRLPAVLTAAIVAAGIGVASCGGEDEHYFCLPDEPLADAGVGQPDANPCNIEVTDPADCPEGCRPIG